MFNFNVLILILHFVFAFCCYGCKEHHQKIAIRKGRRSLEPRFSASDDIVNVEYFSMVMRHGERTPGTLKLYPLFPNNTDTFYPYGIGQLTNEGKRTMFQVGKMLRHRYRKILGHFLFTDTVLGYATHHDRSKHSLLLALAGMYPPKAFQKWHNSIDWQPFAFDFEKGSRDRVFFGAYCTESFENFRRYEKSEEYKKRMAKFEHVTKILEQKTGFRDFILYDAYIYLELLALVDLGKLLPHWSKQIFPKPMEELLIENYHIISRDIESMRFSAGFLLKKILGEFEDKINKTAPINRKLSIYSGHDLNIVSLLLLLGVYEDHVPEYGSYIGFELHNLHGKYGVKIIYEDYSETSPRALIIPGCYEICPFEKFYDLVKHRLPGPEEEKCDRTILP